MSTLLINVDASCEYDFKKELLYSMLVLSAKKLQIQTPEFHSDLWLKEKSKNIVVDILNRLAIYMDLIQFKYSKLNCMTVSVSQDICLAFNITVGLAITCTYM